MGWLYYNGSFWNPTRRDNCVWNDRDSVIFKYTKDFDVPINAKLRSEVILACGKIYARPQNNRKYFGTLLVKRAWALDSVHRDVTFEERRLQRNRSEISRSLRNRRSRREKNRRDGREKGISKRFSALNVNRDRFGRYIFKYVRRGEREKNMERMAWCGDMRRRGGPTHFFFLTRSTQAKVERGHRFSVN